jgi:general secretion pathway protein I
LRRSAQQGFTLIEVLVALAVFGLAALALLRLEGAGSVDAARLETRLVGQMVARNVAIEAMLEANPPAIGSNSGVSRNGGRAWRWTRLVRPAPEPRLIEIAVDVRDEQGDAAGRISMFRPAA